MAGCNASTIQRFHCICCHCVSEEIEIETCPFDDPDEVFEDGLSPLVGDDRCCDVAEDVGTAGVNGIQIAGAVRGEGREGGGGRGAKED